MALQWSCLLPLYPGTHLSVKSATEHTENEGGRQDGDFGSGLHGLSFVSLFVDRVTAYSKLVPNSPSSCLSLLSTGTTCVCSPTPQPRPLNRVKKSLLREVLGLGQCLSGSGWKMTLLNFVTRKHFYPEAVSDCRAVMDQSGQRLIPLQSMRLLESVLGSKYFLPPGVL